MSNASAQSKEVIFIRDAQGVDPYDRLVGVWRRLAQRFYTSDLVPRISDARFFNAQSYGLDYQDINSKHGVDFLNDVIPSIIDRKAKEGNEKMRILDSGCGLAFAADQIRERFGDSVKVYGTSLSRNSSVANRKRNMIDLLRSADQAISPGPSQAVQVVLPEIRDMILASIGRDNKNDKRVIHRHDAKWRSVLELSDYPEFDLIIDTFGELFYSNGELFYSKNISYADKFFLFNFNKTFRAAIKKLRKNGKLFIACLLDWQHKFVKKVKISLEEEYGISIEWNDSYNGLLVTKLI